MHPPLSLLALVAIGSAIRQAPGPHSIHQLQAPSRVRLVLEPRPAKGAEIDPSTLVQLVEVLQRRLAVYGARAATAESSAGRIVVLASGITDLPRLEDLLTESGVLELHITDDQHRFGDALVKIDRILEPSRVRVSTAPSPSSVEQMLGQRTQDSSDVGVLTGALFAGEVPGEFLVHEDRSPFVDSLLTLPTVSLAIPPGVEVRWSAGLELRGGQQFRPLFALDSHSILTDRGIIRASALRDPLTQHAVVEFSLSRAASESFCRETGQHIHDYLAILLNDRVQGPPPVITGSICGGEGQIDLQPAPLIDAQRMAAVMTGGSLPVPLVLIEEKVLGADRAAWSPGLLGVLAALGVLWLGALFLLSRRRSHRSPLQRSTGS